MKELYCFELYNDYTIVVEFIEELNIFEGCAYIHSYHNPEYLQRGYSGEEVFNELKRRIDDSMMCGGY